MRWLAVPWQSDGMKLTLALKVLAMTAVALVPLACGGTNDKDRPSCTDPSMYAPGLPTKCQEGYFYREKSAICTRVDAAAASRPRVSGSLECSRDPGMCSAFAYGVCVNAPSNDEAFCVSGCGSDEDCEDGDRCDCNGNGGHGECRHDDCYSDAECERGYHCAATWLSCGMSVFSCQTAKDACFGASDCPEGQYCIVKDGARQCAVSDGCE